MTNPRRAREPFPSSSSERSATDTTSNGQIKQSLKPNTFLLLGYFASGSQVFVKKRPCYHLKNLALWSK